MKAITAYQCADGRMFTDERKANEHDEDLLGEALDELTLFLLPDVDRQAKYRGLLAAMKQKDKVRELCGKVVRVLDFVGMEEDL